MLLDVPGVSASALRTGLLNDAEARDRLFGGSVTLDRHLLLVASLGDAEFARAFAKQAGRRPQAREDALRQARVRRRAAAGAARARHAGRQRHRGRRRDRARRARRPDRGHAQRRETFAFAARKVDRVRVDGGDGIDTFTIEGERLELQGRRRPRADRRRRARRRRDRQGQGRARSRSATSPRPTSSRSSPTPSAPRPTGPRTTTRSRSAASGCSARRSSSSSTRRWTAT